MKKYLILMYLMVVSTLANATDRGIYSQWWTATQTYYDVAPSVNTTTNAVTGEFTDTIKFVTRFDDVYSITANQYYAKQTCGRYCTQISSSVLKSVTLTRDSDNAILAKWITGTISAQLPANQQYTLTISGVSNGTRMRGVFGLFVTSPWSIIMTCSQAKSNLELITSLTQQQVIDIVMSYKTPVPPSTYPLCTGAL